jgi:hypothetical protein
MDSTIKDTLAGADGARFVSVSGDNEILTPSNSQRAIELRDSLPNKDSGTDEVTN